MGKINEIKTQFGDLSKEGKLKTVTVGDDSDEKELELDIQVPDLHPIFVMSDQDNPSEDDVEMLTEKLQHILYRSYLPHFDEGNDRVPRNLNEEQKQENKEAKEFLDNLLLEYYMDVFFGVMKAANMVDESLDKDTLQNRVGKDV